METRKCDECSEEDSYIISGIYCCAAGCSNWICINCRQNADKQDLCSSCFTVTCHYSVREPHPARMIEMTKTAIGEMCFECFDVTMARAIELNPASTAPLPAMSRACPYCKLETLCVGEFMCFYCRQNFVIVFKPELLPRQPDELRLAIAVIWLKKNTTQLTRQAIRSELYGTPISGNMSSEVRLMFRFIREYKGAPMNLLSAFQSAHPNSFLTTDSRESLLWDLSTYINKR